MCVFSYSKKFIFFHIPKCAGTSMYSAIKDYLDFEKFIHDTHVTYIDSKKKFYENGKNDWFDNAKKFTIVRNPIDRIKSMFKYIKTQPTHYLNNKILDFNFYDFCIFLRDEGDSGIISCYEHIKDEKGKIDNITIFKVEELQENIVELSKIVETKLYEIPKINISEYEIKNKDLKKSIPIIKSIYKEDFKLFYPKI